MPKHVEPERSAVLHGDCLETAKSMGSNTIDAVVTDPPYGIVFRGTQWDHGIPGAPFWKETLRVAKPGAYLLSFGGTRTFHRLTCAIEDGGWEVRDCLMWVYGSGFPKSQDVSKMIDKVKGAERPVLRTEVKRRVLVGVASAGHKAGPLMEYKVTAPASDEAKLWDGWGTSLKPAWEPIIMARKAVDGTIANNLLKWGTGAINIDGCRVGGTKDGRWPTNFMHDGSQMVLDLFPDAGPSSDPDKSVSRFFYCAKVGPAERHMGAETRKGSNQTGATDDEEGGINDHATMKPLALMRHLCRLVTPADGVVLDPFCGSGSTGVAAVQEGFRFIGIDTNPAFVKIAQSRIRAAGGRP